ncbi:hypothetical protein FBEOM_3643, partial [Fusarium beomiforme]
MSDSRNSAEIDQQTPGVGQGSRLYKACAACRSRKLRCIIENREACKSCVQCLKDGRECVFQPKKRAYDTGTRTRKALEKRARLLPPEAPASPENSVRDELNVRTSADALLFLSGASPHHNHNISNAAGVSDHDIFNSPSTRVSDRISATSNGHNSNVATSTREHELRSPPSPCENPNILDSISTFGCRLFSEQIFLVATITYLNMSSVVTRELAIFTMPAGSGRGVKWRGPTIKIREEDHRAGSCLIMSQSLGRRLSRPGLMTFEDVDLGQISQAFRERNERLSMASRDTGSHLNLSLGVSDSSHEAFVQLMKLLSHAQDVLHAPTRDGIIESKVEASRGHTRLLTLLQHFDMLNNNWKSQYMEMIQSNSGGMSHLSRLILQLDFEYLRLYEFSIALGAYSKSSSGQKDFAVASGQNLADSIENDWRFPSSSFAYYIEQSIDAAEGLLRLMLHIHSPQISVNLRYASSRYYMKIVFSSVFLIQALRTGIPSPDYRNIIITTLKDAITTLKSCSIDAAHPALRYSTLLRGLMRDIEQPQP